ncbi:hypothetical protein BD413DRAFT_477522 [Trametes elegans]|nr:hypothetical protein BD413DRAFT_477522 [Trametes elegans]
MSSATPATSSSPYRLSVLLTPKEGVSFEEFHHLWTEVLAPLFGSLPIVKRNLLKYEQFRIDPVITRALAREYAPDTPSYGGMVIYEAETLEKIREVFQDEEYLGKVLPVEERFIDRQKTQILVGQYVTLIGA